MTTHQNNRNMKVHNDLKELLEDFVKNYYEKGDPWEMTLSDVIDEFVSSNSLALDKQRPLAKNKQFDNVFKSKCGATKLGSWCNCCNVKHNCKLYLKT